MQTVGQQTLLQQHALQQRHLLLEGKIKISKYQMAKDGGATFVSYGNNNGDYGSLMCVRRLSRRRRLLQG
jgi:hypothetical protein